MLRLFWHYVFAQAGRSIVERRYFEHFSEQVNQPDMQVGFLLGFGKLLRIF